MLTPTILAIDTSTQACSVALISDDRQVEQFELIPRLHARKLLPMVTSLLSDADLELNDLDAIAFGRGPGSFTGLRIAAGVVQGLAFGANLPVIPVSTLAALAQGIYREKNRQTIIPVLDARMNEIYWGCYEVRDGLVEPLSEEQLTQPVQLDPQLVVSNPDRVDGLTWTGVGEGWRLAEHFPDALRAIVTTTYQDFYPHAMDIAKLAVRDFRQGLAVKAEQACPVYMRGKSAWRKKG